MIFPENRLQEHMARYGYALADTPIVEQSWLFLAKAGDQIIERLVTIEHGGRELALRPEFTASAAHQYLQQSEEVVRWQFSGVVFEDAPGSTTGIRQHQNMGAELIGLGGTASDAEIMQMAALGLNAIELPQWRIVVGHVGLMRAMLDLYALDARSLRFLLNHRVALHTHGKAYVVERINHYLNGSTSDPVSNGVTDPASTVTGDIFASDEMRDHITRTLLASVNTQAALGGRTREEIARRLLQKQQQAAHRDQIIAACDFLDSWGQIAAPIDAAFDAMNRHTTGNPVAHKLVDDWYATLQLLIDTGVRHDQIIIQPDLARTWDYYTGVVFELRLLNGHQTIPDTLAGGGGRYDELIQLIGGTDSTPAVGFAYYMDAIKETIATGG